MYFFQDAFVNYKSFMTSSLNLSASVMVKLQFSFLCYPHHTANRLPCLPTIVALPVYGLMVVERNCASPKEGERDIFEQ
jgi:hypothetical protein